MTFQESGLNDSNVFRSQRLLSPPPRRKNRRIRQKPFELSYDPYDTTKPERALWVAVITQAMMDALSRSNNAEARYQREESIRWLTSNSKDFVTVCLYAGFDPDYIRKRVKQTLASPRLWRAEPGKGKRYLERKAYRERLRAEALRTQMDDSCAHHTTI